MQEGHLIGNKHILGPGPYLKQLKGGTWNCQGLCTHDKGQRQKRRDTIEQMLSWLDVLVVTDTHSSWDWEDKLQR